jgi:hypothetical protein
VQTRKVPCVVAETDKLSSSGDSVISGPYVFDPSDSSQEEEEVKDWKTRQEEKSQANDVTESEPDIDEVFLAQGEQTKEQKDEMAKMERDQRTMELAHKIEKLRDELRDAEDEFERYTEYRCFGMYQRATKSSTYK